MDIQELEKLRAEKERKKETQKKYRENNKEKIKQYDKARKTYTPVSDQQIEIIQPIIEQQIEIDQPIIDQPIEQQIEIDQPIIDQPIIEQQIEIDQPIIEQQIEIDQPIIDQPIIEQQIEINNLNEIINSYDDILQIEPDDMSAISSNYDDILFFKNAIQIKKEQLKKDAPMVHLTQHSNATDPSVNLGLDVVLRNLGAKQKKYYIDNKQEIQNSQKDHAFYKKYVKSLSRRYKITNEIEQPTNALTPNKKELKMREMIKNKNKKLK